jgi:hypothetical protein
MKISDNYRKIIVKEIDYVLKMMDETGAAEKLYYFTGIHNVISRIFNLEYDTDLIYMHFILQQTYGAFQSRLQSIQKGGDKVVPLTAEHFEKLTLAIKELRTRIKKKEDIDPTLRKFVLLAFSTTGNGWYLLQKGLLKI